jgi:hypothetical protein
MGFLTLLGAGRRPIASGGSFRPDADAYFTAAGITDAGAKTLINQFFEDLDNSGILSGIDAMWLLANQSEPAARVNLVDPGTFDLTPSGTIVFTQWMGAKSDGTSYYETGYNPSVNATNYTLHSASLAVFIKEIIASAVLPAGCIDLVSGAPKDAYLFPDDGGGSFGGILNNVNAIAVPLDPPPAPGFYSVTRSAGNIVKLFCDGVEVASDSPPGTIGIADQEFYVLAGNANDTPDFFYTGNVGIVVVSSNSVAQAALNTHVQTLIAGLEAL